MIDYNQEIEAALSTILATHYELTIEGTEAKPCITYQEYNNADTEYGETIGYSDIEFMVKVWTNSKATLETYSLQVDNKMRELGFHRVSGNELAAGNQICKLLLYAAQGFETYDDDEPSSEE